MIKQAMAATLLFSCALGVYAEIVNVDNAELARLAATGGMSAWLKAGRQVVPSNSLVGNTMVETSLIGFETQVRTQVARASPQ